ncbi:MAG: CDP-alcohol phosphatidyltransferase family protein [Gammaproteobacteria bacterium]
MMSIYQLKPRFQQLLRPAAAALYQRGATANQVTLAACAISLAVGALLCLPGIPRAAFIALPLWMFLRMALNAIDGMLAREFGQQSPLGAYLNELTDVISDAALYLPFAFVAPFSPFWIALLIVLAILSEFAGAYGLALGVSRRYDGPLGKSDRAFVFGALGLAVAFSETLPAWLAGLVPLLAAGTALTVANRVRAGLKELAGKQP